MASGIGDGGGGGPPQATRFYPSLGFGSGVARMCRRDNLPLATHFFSLFGIENTFFLLLWSRYSMFIFLLWGRYILFPSLKVGNLSEIGAHKCSKLSLTLAAKGSIYITLLVWHDMFLRGGGQNWLWGATTARSSREVKALVTSPCVSVSNLKRHNFHCSDSL